MLFRIVIDQRMDRAAQQSGEHQPEEEEQDAERHRTPQVVGIDVVRQLDHRPGRVGCYG